MDVGEGLLPFLRGVRNALKIPEAVPCVKHLFNPSILDPEISFKSYGTVWL